MNVVYQLTDATLPNNAQRVIRVGDQASIPDDPGNVDWMNYLSWLKAGGVPTSYVEPPPNTTLIAAASYAAGLQRKAAALAKKGQTWPAVQLLLKSQGLSS
jgi:hypothetical protein